jgi:hypothetical protein
VRYILSLITLKQSYKQAYVVTVRNFSKSFWSSLLGAYGAIVGNSAADETSNDAAPSSNGATIAEDQSQTLLPDTAAVKRSLRVLSLLLRPLLCDVFAIQNFAKAVTILKLSYADVVTLLAPFLSLISMSMLFAGLVSRPMTSSPLQRWLRDVISELLNADETQTLDDAEPRPVADFSLFNSRSYIRHPSALPAPASGFQNHRARSTFRAEHRSWSPVTSGSGAAHAHGRAHSPTASVARDWDMTSSGAHVVSFLKPVLMHLRRWRKLEHAFVVGCLITEVLESVSGQLERKTYGQVSYLWTL